MSTLLESKPLKNTTTPVGPDFDLSVEQRAALSDSVNPEQTSDPAENPAANLISGPANTFISLTRDEKKKTEPNAGAIWICAGMSNALVDKAPETEQGLKQLAKKNPNLDASFITISAKSDIDEDLGLAKGSVGNPPNTAAIAIKASDLRMVARNGIKLITRTDMVNEKGGEYGSIKGVDIIAGNDDSNLQSMVKGENLIAFLSEVMDMISSLAGTLEVLAKHQNDLNIKVASHTHTVIGAGAGANAGGPIATLVNGNALVAPEVSATGALTTSFIT